jgi:uncharacterized membrane protein (UPF0182 family)
VELPVLWLLIGFSIVAAFVAWANHRYLLLYGDNGVVIGASYTDIHVERPLMWVFSKLLSALELAADRSIRRNASQVAEQFHGLRVTDATTAALSDGHASPRRCCRCV